MKNLMKAALFNGMDKYIIEDIPIPEKFDDSALIKIMQTGICGSDLQFHRKNKKEKKLLPGGHEVAGEIVEITPGEHNLSVGDRVAIEGIGAGRACLKCFYCNNGQWKHCQNQYSDTGGGFAQYMTRRPTGLFKIPDNVDWLDAALVEPLAVAVHAFRYAEMKPKSIVGIVGASTVGLACVGAAKFLGASKVIISAKYKHQADAAKKMGADIITNVEEGEFEEICKSQTDGKGADLVVESIGGHQTKSFTQAVSSTRAQGTMLYLGGVKVPLVFDMFEPFLREIKIISSLCYGIIETRHDFDVAIEILSKNYFPYRDIVTHTYNLEDIQTGIDTAINKDSGSIKVHIKQW